jgi:hypothetical protein
LPKGSAAATWLKNNLGLDIGVPGVSWGLALGSDLADYYVEDAPVSPAIPYFYEHSQLGPSAKLGNIEVSTQTGALDVVFDPADPAVYVGVSHLPGVVPGLSVGVSEHGRLKYDPATKPQDWTGEMFGHLYRYGAVDLFDALKVPVSVEGASMINLDANNDGTLLGGLLSSGKVKMSNILAGNVPTGLASQVAQDFSFGVDGKLNLAVSESGLELKVNLVKGTVVYDGPAKAIYGRMTLQNPLAGIDMLKDTPLASLADSNVTADFTVAADSRARITLSGLMSSIGADAAWSVTADGAGVHADFTIDVGTYAALAQSIEVSVAGLDVLPSAVRDALKSAVGAKAHLKGDISPDGSFDFTGTAAMSLLGVYSGSWQVEINQDGLWLSNVISETGKWWNILFDGAQSVSLAAFQDTRMVASTVWTDAADYVTALYNSEGGRIDEVVYEGGQLASHMFVQDGQLVEEYFQYASGHVTQNQLISDLGDTGMSPTIDDSIQATVEAVTWKDDVITFLGKMDPDTGVWQTVVDTVNTTKTVIQEGWDTFVNGLRGV